MYMGACLCTMSVQEPTEVTKWFQIPWNWSYIDYCEPTTTAMFITPEPSLQLKVADSVRQRNPLVIISTKAFSQFQDY